ncbi:MAG: N-acetyltransferase [Candidatus Methylarchaceae archaeon HK01M]|nr:N-acetyltransferase [Candidatus Methylarchaceae archaeon HK01M]
MKKLHEDKIVNHVGKDVELGRNVKLWHFSYIGDGTKIGDNVTIGSLSHIDYKVKIGNNCRIEGNVYISPLTVIGSGVFIGPGVIFTNDPYPPSKRLVGITVEDGSIIGAGSTIKAGVRIGKNSVIAMGALVTDDVPPGTVVMGIPAKPSYSRTEYEKKREDWEKV